LRSLKFIQENSFLTTQEGGEFESVETSIPEETTLKHENKQAPLSANMNALLKTDLLQKLGFYKQMPEEFYNYKDGGKLLNHLLYISIKHNDQYCKQADAYNIMHPENVFNSINFITDYSGEG